MQRFAIMVAAAAALIFAQAPQALAGAAAAAAPKPPPPITKQQTDQGMKEAPPLAQAAGAPCTIQTAAFLGTATQAGADGKPVQLKIYELACSEGLGYVIMAKPNEKPQAYDCVAIKGSGSMTCNLPANANPAAGLQKFVTAAGATCTINNARYLGSSPASGINRYEIGCSEGTGYVLDTPLSGSSAKPAVMSCLKAESGQMDCQYTPKAQRVSHIATVAAAAPNAKDCTAAQARWVTSDTGKGTDYYEIGCEGGKPGYMVEISTAGEKFVRALGCAQATGIAGGCNFTDVNTAATSENGTYTTVATAADGKCGG
jgi:hypothetical protein